MTVTLEDDEGSSADLGEEESEVVLSSLEIAQAHATLGALLAPRAAIGPSTAGALPSSDELVRGLLEAKDVRAAVLEMVASLLVTGEAPTPGQVNGPLACASD